MKDEVIDGAVARLHDCSRCGGRPYLECVREVGRVVPNLYDNVWLQCKGCGIRSLPTTTQDWWSPREKRMAVLRLFTEWSEIHGKMAEHPHTTTGPAPSPVNLDQLPVHLL